MKRWFYKTFKRDVFQAFNWDINKKKKIKETCFVVFDTETTGLDLKRDFPISIGALKVEDLTIDLSQTFYEIIKPPKEFEDSIKVHGLTPKDLEGGLDTSVACRRFLDYARGCILVGYFVHIDVNMIKRLVEKGCDGVFYPYTLDVLELDPSLGKDKIPRLEDILKAFNLPVSQAHNALEDAYMTALLFLRLVKPYGERALSHLPIKVI